MFRSLLRDIDGDNQLESAAGYFPESTLRTALLSPGMTHLYRLAIVLTFHLAACVGLFAAPPSASWFPKAAPLPPPTGEVIRVETVDQLFQAARDVPVGGTILVADGHYMMPRYFAIKTDNVTLRSESGNRDKVILDGARSRHGELVGITGATGVMIADLTIQNIKHNGFKINSNLGTERVTIRNCVIHNIWQRGIKAPAMPEELGDKGPRECRIEYCLFYNDRPKRYADDETDTPNTYDGNYIGGIDVKNTVDWTISDNVFVGIHGRTREGRAGIYISENGRGCTIERNTFLDCDIAIALGNPSLGYSPLQAIDCVARNNLVVQCPETGILACYTRNCRITNNTIFEPDSRLRRLIWAQKTNEGLRVSNNLLIGPPLQNTSETEIVENHNRVVREFDPSIVQDQRIGQTFLSAAEMKQGIELPGRLRQASAAAHNWLERTRQPPETIEAMRAVHAGFQGQTGYVAQFGDSITYSMAFWRPMGWSDPQPYLLEDDGLPKRPPSIRWRDYIKGTQDKGPQYANYSGWRVGQVSKAMDEVLRRDRPEVAIIMVGTNDISGGRMPDGYPAALEQVARKCIESNCIPILNTIPPRRDRDEAVATVNETIRALCKRLRLPLVDFQAECLRLRPGDSWDGTLIDDDGVHPSGGKSNDYSEQNLSVCGYALRNWLNFLVYRQLYFQVLAEE